jgi:ABC-2 type transport system permease protein
MRKYLRLLRYAARDQLVYLPAFMARNLFFVAILFTFFSLWRVVFSGQGSIAGLTLVQTLWYLTFTEAVELARPRVFSQIQEEVKDGSLAYSLTKPYHYPLFYLSRSMGEGCVRLLPILALGFLLATAFVGLLPGYLRALPFGLLLMLGGLLLSCLWQLLIGLLAFWTEEVSPFFWILQKLVFILGGMFIPIDFFPPWLQGVARYLPFAFSAYWPASCMVEFSLERFAIGLSGVLFYGLLLGGAVMGVFALGRRRVHVQGG